MGPPNRGHEVGVVLQREGFDRGLTLCIALKGRGVRGSVLLDPDLPLEYLVSILQTQSVRYLFYSCHSYYLSLPLRR